jgi:hypothetical protein
MDVDHAPVRQRLSPRFWALLALALVPLNFGAWLLTFCWAHDTATAWAGLGLFTLLALVQLVAGITALVAGIRARRAAGRGLGAAVLGALAALGAVAGWAGGTVLGLYAMGGAWGRPLRVRGRQVHPELREGADWTDGERPGAAALDAATRAALAALWLHDAQKEHASVPAFARVSWLLAAVGAPAELLAWSHRAALEEIEHTRRCFALAAGYGGRAFTVEPMPELLLAELAPRGNAFALLATESLGDGCQLEDFNADVAAACAGCCTEPVTRAVLERIAREERSHAEFSWALLGWLLECHGSSVRPALQRALRGLDRYPRPTAANRHNTGLVARADADALRRHGRLPDESWSELWRERLARTRQRAHALVAGAPARPAASRAESCDLAPMP